MNNKKKPHILFCGNTHFLLTIRTVSSVKFRKGRWNICHTNRWCIRLKVWLSQCVPRLNMNVMKMRILLEIFLGLGGRNEVVGKWWKYICFWFWHITTFLFHSFLRDGLRPRFKSVCAQRRKYKCTQHKFDIKCNSTYF